MRSFFVHMNKTVWRGQVFDESLQSVHFSV